MHRAQLNATIGKRDNDDPCHMTELNKTRMGLQPPLKPNQKAYVLDGEDVSDLADLANVERDLELAGSACRIVTTRTGSPSTNMVRRACIDSALMRYRRCFTTGRRTRLGEEDILDFDSSELKLHDLVLFLANKSIAHSVDGSEQGFPYLLVEYDPTSGRFTSRVKTYASQPSHYNLIDAEAFEALCMKVRAVAHDKANTLAGKIAARIEGKLPGYLKSLPEVAEVLMDRDELLRRWEADALAAGMKRRREAGMPKKS
jgi:hypothetical protein